MSEKMTAERMTAGRAPLLTRFELLVETGQHRAALDEALLILLAIDRAKGSLNGQNIGAAFADGDDRDLHVQFATRFASAYGRLITAPGVQIDGEMVEALFIMHHWSDMMFALGGLRGSAHLRIRFSHDAEGEPQLDPGNLVQHLLLLSPAGSRPVDLDRLYALHPVATILAVLGYLTGASCVSANAVALRERMLEWLPGRLGAVNLSTGRLGFISEPYMHCSYAFSPRKHTIKGALIAQLHRALLAAGAQEMAAPPAPAARPRVVVVTEHFSAGHSVYRTHSRAVRSLLGAFDVTGVVYGQRCDPLARACFHRVIEYPDGELIGDTVAVAARIRALDPHMVFFLGVGMAGPAVALAALRLAPVQCVSYGHTATTMSPAVDLMILPEDFVAAREVYSEQLLLLPPAALPYAPPAEGEAPVPPRPPRARPLSTVRIGVPASVLKINAVFLQALAEVAARAANTVEFEFFPLSAVGLVHYHLEQEIHRILPGAVVNPQLPRELYLERLGACDFFASPFPYGNMNSIVDAMLMGVPGVCLDGAEAHAHADAAFFTRFGLPGELIARSREDYVTAALRLVDDAAWRAECQRAAGSVDPHAVLYAGDETAFRDAIAAVLAERGLLLRH